jgi:hypothetical protein
MCINTWPRMKFWITARFGDLSRRTIQVNILSLISLFLYPPRFDGACLAELLDFSSSSSKAAVF